MDKLLKALEEYDKQLREDTSWAQIFSDGSGIIGTMQVREIYNFSSIEEAIAWLRGDNVGCE